MALFGVALGAFVSLILFATGRKGWWLGLGFATLWGVLTFVVPMFGYQKSKRAVQARQCEQIEGVATDYSPQPYEGHAPGDRFIVNGREFEFSNFAMSSGYMRTVAYGGVHLAGRHVRMCVLEGDILRLEVQRLEWPVEASTVRFRLVNIDEVNFSKALYETTQQSKVRAKPVVWAKDFGLSDFDLTVAGACERAVADLEPVIVDAAKRVADGAQVISSYRASATCLPSVSPPERLWKAAPKVRIYSNAGGVMTDSGTSSATPWMP